MTTLHTAAMVSLRVAAAAAVIAVVATLAPAAAAPAQAPATMSIERAGKYYINGACANTRVGESFQRRVFGPDNEISYREIRARLPELRRLGLGYARSEYRWARHLLNPPAQWPDEVAGIPDRLADRNLSYGALLREQAYAETAQQWGRTNVRINRFGFETYASQIRARLDLPPPGEGCGRG